MCCSKGDLSCEGKDGHSRMATECVGVGLLSWIRLRKKCIRADNVCMDAWASH